MYIDNENIKFFPVKHYNDAIRISREIINKKDLIVVGYEKLSFYKNSKFDEAFYLGCGLKFENRFTNFKFVRDLEREEKLYNKFKGNDIMSPGGNTSGYGERTLFGPEGAIQLNNKDTVIAGTNLFDGTAQATSPSVSINMAPLVNEMQAVKAVLVQILNKDSNVYMDGAKVGKGVAMASSKIG
jgi:hypothetical protein